MWSTIENFKESLSQITADVLDAAEELEPNGSDLSTDGSEASSRHHTTHPPSSHRSQGDQIFQNGKDSSILIPNGSLSRMNEYEVHNRKLQAREKDLLRQISDNKVAYMSLQDSYEKALTEIHTLKEALENHMKGSSNARGQLQRNRKMLEDADANSRQMKAEKEKMAMEITELRHKLAEKVAELNNARNQIKTEVMKEFEAILRVKDEKAEELQTLVKELEKKNLELQGEVTSLKQRRSDHENHVTQYNEIPVEARDSSVQENNAVKEAKSDFHLERKDYQKRIDALCAERDKALRNLDRLRQHLIEKETSDTAKMERDGKLIKELEQKADASIMRAMRSEQTLAQTLALQEDVNRRNAKQLEEAQQENSTLKKKLSACMSALESKDSELTNLQAALGQYYAESETKERLHLELAATKNELNSLLDQIRIMNTAVEMKDKEKGELLEKLTLQQKKVDESEEKAHKLEADILMMRRALEQSLTRLNRMSSDSDYYVDRRIVIKLLVTYFQRHQSKEVLDLMARMLGFSEEEKKSISIAQQGGKGMVRGVLGLPSRVVGGLLKADSSSPRASSLQADNQSSFSDLWIDFLLKETEERERRDTAMAEASAQGLTNSVHASGSSSGVSGKTDSGNTTDDIPGSEFSVVPLNSASVRNSNPPRT